MKNTVSINTSGTAKATESNDVLNNAKIIDYPINKYDVKVVVNQDNKFVGIEEVKINKDFLTNKEKASQKGYHDVSEYYKE